MKIFVEISAFKEENYRYLVQKYTDTQFTVNPMDYDIDAIISNPGFLNRENLELYNGLKWIHLLTAGYNTVDLEYLKSRKIIMTNAKDVFSIQIAEDVFSKILYFNRNIKTYIENKKTGEWKHERVFYEIANSTVGILGTGSIGHEIAKRIKSFDTRIIGYRKTAESRPFFDEVYHDQDGLEKIYKESDYLIIALPLSKETSKMINKEAFSLMKPSVLIINVARGEIIDQEALVEALITHQIRGAGLDVTVPEPLPKDSPLWTLDNVYITPHNASASPYVYQRLLQSVDQSIDNYINNRKLTNRII